MRRDAKRWGLIFYSVELFEVFNKEKDAQDEATNLTAMAGENAALKAEVGTLKKGFLALGESYYPEAEYLAKVENYTKLESEFYALKAELKAARRANENQRTELAKLQKAQKKTGDERNYLRAALEKAEAELDALKAELAYCVETIESAAEREDWEPNEHSDYPRWAWAIFYAAHRAREGKEKKGEQL